MVAVRLKVQKELVAAKPRATFQLRRLKLKNICYKKIVWRCFQQKLKEQTRKKEEGEKSRFIFYEMHELLAISMGGALKVLYFYLKRNRSRILAQALI